MNIRYPDNTELKDEIRDLWRIAFGDTEAFLSAYFGGIWQGENALTMLENNHVIGALELVPYTLSVRSQDVKTSYIVGVSTLPSHRKRGVAKALMRAALSEQKKRGEAFSLLIPFSYEFYEKMGYAACYDESHSKVKVEMLPTVSGGTFSEADINDFPVLNNIYKAFCRDKNAYVHRSKAEWQFVFSFLKMLNGKLIAYRDQSRTPAGYTAFFRDKKRFCVLEMAYENENTLSALLSFIKKEAAEYQTVDFVLPANASSFFEGKIHTFAMARIVDVPKALSQGLGSLRLKVTDGFLPENSGIYEEIEGSVYKVQGRYDAEISINALTQLVLGYCSAGELLTSGELSVSDDFDVARLNALYPKQQNYINFILRDV